MNSLSFLSFPNCQMTKIYSEIKLGNRAETAHACAKTRNFLSPLSSLQKIPKLGHTWIFCSLGLKLLIYNFKKGYLSKHFLISDCSMTSFYAVSALSSWVVYATAKLSTNDFE